MLCESVELPGLFSGGHGPTERARELLANNGAGLSLGQKVFLFVAWDIWDGSSPPRRPAPPSVGHLFRVLDTNNLRKVGELLLAASAGADAVDDWIRRYDTGLIPRLK